MSRLQEVRPAVSASVRVTAAVGDLPGTERASFRAGVIGRGFPPSRVLRRLPCVPDIINVTQCFVTPEKNVILVSTMG